MTMTTLSESTLDILNQQEHFRYLFQRYCNAGHRGITNWYNRGEIIRFIYSLGEASFKGVDKPNYEEGERELTFEGYDIDYVIARKKRVSDNSWRTSREYSQEYVLKETEKYQIARWGRETVSTNLEYRETTYLYVFI